MKKVFKQGSLGNIVFFERIAGSAYRAALIAFLIRGSDTEMAICFFKDVKIRSVDL